MPQVSPSSSLPAQPGCAGTITRATSARRAWQEIAEDDDLAAFGLLRERRRDQVGRRHQAVDVLMVLVEHHAVEAVLVGIGELVDIFLVESAAARAVPQAVRHRDPAGVVNLVEVGGEVRVRHKVPAIELDRIAHGLPSRGPTSAGGMLVEIWRRRHRQSCPGRRMTIPQKSMSNRPLTPWESRRAGDSIRATNRAAGASAQAAM